MTTLPVRIVEKATLTNVPPDSIIYDAGIAGIDSQRLRNGFVTLEESLIWTREIFKPEYHSDIEQRIQNCFEQ